MYIFSCTGRHNTGAIHMMSGSECLHSQLFITAHQSVSFFVKHMHVVSRLLPRVRRLGTILSFPPLHNIHSYSLGTRLAYMQASAYMCTEKHWSCSILLWK